MTPRRSWTQKKPSFSLSPVPGLSTSRSAVRVQICPIRLFNDLVAYTPKSSEIQTGVPPRAGCENHPTRGVKHTGIRRSRRSGGECLPASSTIPAPRTCAPPWRSPTSGADRGRPQRLFRARRYDRSSRSGVGSPIHRRSTEDVGSLSLSLFVSLSIYMGPLTKLP